MRNKFGPVELGNVIGDGAEGQIDDLARIRRDIGRAGVNQITVEHHDRTGRPGWCDNAALFSQFGDSSLIQRPEGIRRGAGVVLSIESSALVTFRDEH